MRRPWQVWLAFTTSLLVAVTAVGWLSYRAIESDRADALAAEQAAREELARLAMWRLDSAAATLIAQENAQPYFAYRPLYSGRGVSDGPPRGKMAASTLRPSPLLTEKNTSVRLYFEVDSLGTFSSPSVPPADLLSSVVPAYLSAETVAANRRRLEALARADLARATAGLHARGGSLGTRRPPGAGQRPASARRTEPGCRRAAIGRSVCTSPAATGSRTGQRSMPTSFSAHAVYAAERGQRHGQ